MNKQAQLTTDHLKRIDEMAPSIIEKLGLEDDDGARRFASLLAGAMVIAQDASEECGGSQEEKQAVALGAASFAFDEIAKHLQAHPIGH